MKFPDVQIERVQEYWDQRPCNIRHSAQPIGTRQYFEEVEARKYFVEPHIPAFADFPRWQGKRVLEIGCGIGTDTVNFARHGAVVTAMDISSKSLELAAQRMRIYGLENQVRFYLGNAEELSRTLPVEPYDLIYSFGVIHHTPHPETALEELRKFAQPGTVLKIMVYHRRSWKVLHIIAAKERGKFWRLQELIARNSEAQTGCPVTYTFTRRQARQLLERHGFCVRDARVEHIFSYRVPDYMQYRYIKEFYFGWMPRKVFEGFEKVLGWHLCLTAEA